MSSIQDFAQERFAKNALQPTMNSRTLRAFMALQNQEVAGRLVELRHGRGNPPQEVVSTQIGVSYRSLQAWESGETRPSYRNLERLADYYGVSVEWILTGTDEPTHEQNATGIEELLDWRRRIDPRVDAVEFSLLQINAKLDLLLDRLDVHVEGDDGPAQLVQVFKDYAAARERAEPPRESEHP